MGSDRRFNSDKILDLVADILDGEPFTGLGKPEPLKYIEADTWSRRIDLEHRLVYKEEKRNYIKISQKILIYCCKILETMYYTVAPGSNIPGLAVPRVAATSIPSAG
jgi:Txe/YoeB family toxin of toxin-antitoxin system